MFGRNAYERQYRGPALTRPLRHFRRWMRYTRTVDIAATFAVLLVAVAVVAAAAITL